MPFGNQRRTSATMTTMWTLIGAVSGILVALILYNLGYDYPGWGIVHLCWVFGALLGWGIGKLLAAAETSN
jgi:hypothetical protein